jgi:phosphoserine phosphatase
MTTSAFRVSRLLARQRFSPTSSSATLLSHSRVFASPFSSGTKPMMSVMTDTFDSDKIASFVGNDISGAIAALANANAVCFDVDSTVIQEEGIDVLAETLGKGPEVAAWTAKAMEGGTKFEEALAARLDIIRPSRKDIERCLEISPLQLTPGIEELVMKLNERGIDVYFVSGGFRLMIEPVAKEVCVSKSNIFANTILFDDEGNYAGFDATEPTSADMGKPRALAKIKEEHGYETMIMVGDGATDAQAKPPADAFIGFGGVIVREGVKKKACWYVTDFQDMIEVIEKNSSSKLR